MGDRVAIPNGDSWTQRGVWKGGRLDGKRTATVSCPECGRACSLSQHEIDAEGNVSPSVVCPYDDCDWHVWIRLEGWKP